MIEVDFSTLRAVDGILAAGIADKHTGMLLQHFRFEDFQIDVASAMITQVYRATLKLENAPLPHGGLEDLMLSFGELLYILRGQGGGTHLFAFVVLKKDQTNYALARREFREFCGALVLS